jgi:peptidoglycan-N-acetylglucosamine deacetylase
LLLLRLTTVPILCSPPRLLDILERHKARATFFRIGQNARRYPELVQRVAQAGHTMGHHAWDYPLFP